jgi:zinc transporter ZupT
MTTILLLQINVSKTYADFGDGITGKVANKQVGKLNETLSSLISYAGAFVVVLGVIKLILSIKEEDAGSKVQAFMMIMGGFVFLSAKLIIKAI